MRAWSAPEVPQLPVTGPAVALYDTASGSLVTTTPDGPARLYVCGITPYDATHIGHAATYVGFDLLNRAWRNAGHQVVFVENVTDVDDPLLERAAKVNVDWTELAERETELFRQDMQALRVLPPDHLVGAVESIPLAVALIEKLQEAGSVYRVEDDHYFSVTADPAFGQESNYDRDTMLEIFPERGGDPDRPGKRHPTDALLWRMARDGEPFWESDLGAGRPGWHVECAAIALNRLGPQIDVNGGGSDLIFPHHECGAAHAEAHTGVHPFAKHYVHAGMIGLDGEKMSKSRGNLVFVSKLRATGVDPNAIRLALLAGHYRADRAWTPDLLTAAEKRLTLWSAAVGHGSTRHATGPDADHLIDLLRTHLASDLDTPNALVAVDRWAHRAREGAGDDPGARLRVRDAVDALLGVAL